MCSVCRESFRFRLSFLGEGAINMFPLLLQVLPPICMLYKVAMTLLPRLKNQKNKLSFEQWLPLHWLLTLPANFLLANLAGYNPRHPGISMMRLTIPTDRLQEKKQKPSTLIKDILLYFAPKPNNFAFYCASAEKYLKKSNSTSYQRISIKLNPSPKFQFLSFFKPSLVGGVCHLRHHLPPPPPPTGPPPLACHNARSAHRYKDQRPIWRWCHPWPFKWWELVMNCSVMCGEKNSLRTYTYKKVGI